MKLCNILRHCKPGHKWCRVMIIFLFFHQSLSYASISTLTIDDENLLIYSARGTDFLPLSESDFFNYDALVESSLVTAQSMQLNIGDEKALNFIIQLYKNKDSRAPVALANYINRYPNDLLAFQLAAIELFSQKKYKEASLALRRILQSNPDYMPASTLLGITWLMLNDNDKGIAQLRKSVTNTHADPLAIRYLTWDALRNGDTEQAMRYLQRNLKIYGIPTESVKLIHLELAEIYRQQEKFAEIIQLFTLLAENKNSDLSNPQNLEAISRLFEAATELSNVRIAQLAEERLQGTAAYNAFPTQIARARLLAMNQQFDQAIAIMESLKSDNKQMELRRLLELAKLYGQKQDNNQGFATLERYIDQYGEKITPNAIREYVNLSIDMGKGNQGLTYLKQLYADNPKNNYLGSVLIEIQMQANDLTGANDTVNKLIKLSPKFAPAYYQKGIILFNQHQNGQAVTAFRQSLKLDPHNLAVWMALMGAVHDHRTHSHTASTASQDHQGLLPLFDEAIAQNPDTFQLYYEKGLTAYSGGELVEAKKAFAQSLLLSPFDLPTLVMSVIVRADTDTDLDYSNKLSEVLLKLAPDNAAVQDAVGWLKVVMGQTQTGLNLLQGALVGMPDDAAVQFHIGMGYVKLEQNDIATAYLMKALVGELPKHSAEQIRTTLNNIQPLNQKTVNVNLINGFGVGEAIGTIMLQDTAEGLLVKADLNDLPPGNNGMHFHLKPSCDAGMENGMRIAGLTAGGHYGHDHMMMGMDMSDPAHAEHMKNMKPRGDLPPLNTDQQGHSNASVVGSQLTLAELRGRSLMIHRGPDIEGSSGPKVACAIID